MYLLIAGEYPFDTKYQGWLQPDVQNVGGNWWDSSSGSGEETEESDDDRDLAKVKDDHDLAKEKVKAKSAALAATRPDSSFTSPEESSDDDSSEANHAAFWF